MSINKHRFDLGCTLIRRLYSLSRTIWFSSCPIALKFDRCLGSSATETPATFQNDYFNKHSRRSYDKTPVRSVSRDPAVDPTHKSNTAPAPYSTMHHSEQKWAHFCFEWCIVLYGTGALWDLWDWSLGFGIEYGTNLSTYLITLTDIYAI